MSSVTAIVVVYVAAIVVLVVGFTGRVAVGLYARLLFRLEDLRHKRSVYHERRRLIVGLRAHRAFEDPCWRMFRDRDAQVARTFAHGRAAVEAAIAADAAARDARAMAALRRDLGPTRPSLVAVPDVREAV